MEMTTERLTLRPWRESDAPQLYEYAKDPRIGPAAGWPAHTCVENSRETIRDVLSAEGTFALTLRGSDDIIGCLGIKKLETSEHAGEPELGYWLGAPFWGQGLVPEAVLRVLELLFDERGAARVWCGHYEGNDKSRRVIEKCGFKFVFRKEVEVPLLGERREELFYCITKEDRGK